MGKNSSSKGEKALARTADEQARIARQLLGEAKPTRNLLFDNANQFLEGGRDVTQLPSFRAGFNVMDEQFQNAQDSIIGLTPEGGGLTSALADLERGRATDISQLAGALSEAEVNRGLQLATFGTAQGSSGLQGAATSQAMRAQAEAQQNAAKSGALGNMVGSAFGMFNFGPK